MGAEVAVNVGVGYEYEEDKLITMDGNETPSRRTLITRDLLGVASDSLSNNNNTNNSISNCKVEFQEQQHELDLDLQAPTGWEKRLDLQSGKVYFQKCNSPVPNSSSCQMGGLAKHCVPKLQDLNFLHSPMKAPLNLFDDAFLDLKLLPSSSPSSSSSCAGNIYNSVCTLDKVRHALERAEKEPIKKRSPFWKPSSPSTSPSHSSSSSYSMKETRGGEDENEDSVLHTPIAAGCPSCLLYVLISVKDPKCPRCNVPVPLPNSKKPRVDLNMSI